MSIAAAITLSILSAEAQDPPRSQPERTVRYGLLLADVRSIDDVLQTMDVDFAVNMQWKDPSLERPAAGSRRRLDDGSVWTPELAILNDERIRVREPVVFVDAEGTVTHRQRFTGTVLERMNLADFPFDHQEFRITVLSKRSVDRPIEFVFDPELGGDLGDWTILDWNISPGTCHTTTVRAQHERADGFEYVFAGRRHAGYYFWKILIPMLLVVGMSFTVFWIDPSLTASQIGVATTAMLTVIAYRFAVSELVPRFSYLTRLDMFLLGSTVLVFLALLEVITTARLVHAQRQELSRRIDRICRRAFPIALAVMVFVTLFA